MTFRVIEQSGPYHLMHFIFKEDLLCIFSGGTCLHALMFGYAAAAAGAVTAAAGPLLRLSLQ